MEGLDYSRPLSLYIHVPFCERKCDYCAFYSVPYCRYEEKTERYIDMLLGEIDALNRDYKKAYKTIFIGGGNPGILGVENLRRILLKASENGMAEETTIEINPENLDESILSLGNLITRISIGIQSMSDKSLRILGRNSDRENNLRALSLLSSSPYRWNADIITAIPGTSPEDTLSDIEEIASYNPGHISFYCLTFEENTPLVKRIKPLDSDTEADFLEKGWEKLRSLGYEHYEVSNFAKKGERCRHNEVYWHLGQYVGFGPGAESSVGYERIISMRDSETVDEYLKRPVMTCSRLSKEESEEEFMLVSLRTSDGIDKNEFGKRFSHSFDFRYGDAVKTMNEESYIDDNEHFALTEKGVMMLDWVILHLVAGI